MNAKKNRRLRVGFRSSILDSLILMLDNSSQKQDSSVEDETRGLNSMSSACPKSEIGEILS